MNEEKPEDGNQMTENSPQKPKASKMAIFTLVLSIYLFPSISLWTLKTSILYILKVIYFPLQFFPLLFPISFLSLPIFAIVSIVISKRSPNKIKGAKYAYVALGLWLITLLLHGYFIRESLIESDCGSNIRNNISSSLFAYCSDNDYHYPLAENWCDILIIDGNLPPEDLICNRSDAVLGESSYAYNVNISGKDEKDVGPFTVVLFDTDAGKEKGKRKALLESREFWKNYKNKKGKKSKQKVYKDRWNQHGGPELLSFKHRKGTGCNVLFSDMHVEFVKAEDIDKLRWEVNKVAVELKIGDKAPAVNLLDQDGNKVKLSDYKGKKVLVYFYPKADTPGCTKQACSVRDSTKELEKAGVVTLGISPDASDKQKKFDDKYDLGFTLLSDTEHKVSQAYGVWQEKSMYGKKYMGIVRSSFLIDEKGKLIGVWYKVNPEDTIPKALAVLE
jgi:peroxiredoxin Q/BCP